MSFLWGYVSSWMNPDQQQAQEQVPPPPPMPDNEKAPEQTPEIKPIKEEPIKYFTLKDFEYFKSEINNFTDYEIVYEEKESKMWTKATGDGSQGAYKRYKYCGVIPYSVETVYATARDYRHRSEWDVRDMGRTVLELIKADKAKDQPAQMIERITKRGIKGVFADRDLVTLNTVKKEKVTVNKEKRDRVLSLTKSVYYADCLEKEGFVRAEILFMGMVLEHYGDNQCRYWVCAEVDPKGWVYSALYNWALHALPLEFEQSMSKGCQARKDKGMSDTDFKDYFAPDATL